MTCPLVWLLCGCYGTILIEIHDRIFEEEEETIGNVLGALLLSPVLGPLTLVVGVLVWCFKVLPYLFKYKV